MLRSEPGTLLETVAGTMTMGTQNSSYFPRAVNNSSNDSKACRAEPRALVCAWWELWLLGLSGATCHKGGGSGKRGGGGWITKSGGRQGEEPGLSRRTAAKQTGTTPHTDFIYSFKNTSVHTYETHLLAYITGKLKLVSIYMGVREMVGQKQLYSVSNKFIYILLNINT